MRYQLKLYLAFICVALFTTALALEIVFIERKKYVFEQLKSEVMTVAATTAVGIDAKLLANIKTVDDEKTEGYAALVTFLRRAREANRRNDINVKFLYTIFPNPSKPTEILYGVDAEENPKDFSHVGDVDYESSLNNLSHHLSTTYGSDSIIEDQWGKWMIAFSPVLDTEGKYVASIGVCISAEKLTSSINTLMWLELVSLSIAFVVAAFVAGFISKTVTSSLKTISVAVEKIGKGDFTPTVFLNTNDEFQKLGESINKMVKGLQEREKLKENFARYVSNYVMEKILKSETPMKLEGERKKITVLFSDLRHFTYLSEKLPPEEIVQILNEYFAHMLEAIFAHMGTLDKFIGDGIMVEFGAPLDDPIQEKNAVLAATAMHKELKKLSAKWISEGKPVIEMGIGIHTGLAVVGNVGSEQHLEYTAIGDTVNVASRLEDATRLLKVPLIISEETYKSLNGEFQAHRIGPMVLHGREEPVVGYAIYV